MIGALVVKIARQDKNLTKSPLFINVILTTFSRLKWNLKYVYILSKPSAFLNNLDKTLETGYEVCIFSIWNKILKVILTKVKYNEFSRSQSPFRKHCANNVYTHYYFSNLIRWVGSRRVGAPGTTGSHETKSSVIRSLLAHPRDQVTKVMMYLLYTYKNNNNKARTIQ